MISQIEIYDQVWYVRHMPPKGEHMLEAMGLVEHLSQSWKKYRMPVQRFPFDLIDQLREEYLSAE